MWRNKWQLFTSYSNCLLLWRKKIKENSLEGIWKVYKLKNPICVIRTNDMHFLFKFIPINILYMFRID